jgi:hypothetical protein
MSTDYTALVRAVADAPKNTAQMACLPHRRHWQVMPRVRSPSVWKMAAWGAPGHSPVACRCHGRRSRRPSLAFLLERAVQDALVQMDDLPHRHFVPFSRRR